MKAIIDVFPWISIFSRSGSSFSSWASDRTCHDDRHVSSAGEIERVRSSFEAR